MYASTMDALQALGHKVSPGGYIIVDDFGAVEGCRKAIADYRKDKGIEAPIQNIDGIGAYWRVAPPVAAKAGPQVAPALRCA